MMMDKVVSIAGGNVALPKKRGSVIERLCNLASHLMSKVKLK